MTDPTTGGSAGGRSPESQASEDAGRARAQVDRELGAAKESLSDARRLAEERARSLVGDATQQARSYADSQKEAAAQSLRDFAEAVRRASDELGNRDQTLAARFVQEAAGGLETLSRSVSSRNIDSVIDSVRDFGRSNPTAFIAGSVLAGIAIGRFARASSERDHQRSGRGSGGHGQYRPSPPAAGSRSRAAPGQTGGAGAAPGGGSPGFAGAQPTSRPAAGASSSAALNPGGPASPSNQWEGR